MGRRRGLWPPATCQKCGQPPELGQSLWPGDGWRCIACLEVQSPGKDMVSKAMHHTVGYHQELGSARRLERDGFTDAATQCRNEAWWAGAKSAALNERGKARVQRVTIAHGEALPRPEESVLHDTLAVPDLAAVEASLERSRLLLHYGPDVAAMALDAADSIKATNSLEKMLAHQLAAAHKIAMEQIGRAHDTRDSVVQTRHLTVATRAMTVFQQGLLALQKLRQGGQQQITVQYVNVR